MIRSRTPLQRNRCQVALVDGVQLLVRPTQREAVALAHDPTMTTPPAKIVMPEETLQRLKTAFCVFDEDGDGTIQPEEMIAAFQRMGQNWDMDAVREFLLAIDADGSGTIEKEEFITFVSNFVGENQ